jgi:hypothetical protein
MEDGFEDILTPLRDGTFKVDRGYYNDNNTLWIKGLQYLVDIDLAGFSTEVKRIQKVYQVMRSEGYCEGEEAVVRPIHDYEISKGIEIIFEKTVDVDSDYIFERYSEDPNESFDENNFH